MNVEVVTPSTITPWPLEEAKDHLRVRHSEDDFYIQMLTGAIVSIAEKITRRSLFTQTLRLWIDRFITTELWLPRPKIQSVTAIKYYDYNGIEQTIDPALYHADLVSPSGRVRPTSSYSWPSPQTYRYNAVNIEYIAGWTKRGDMPEALKLAMLLHLSHLYDIREPVVVGAVVSEVPYSIRSLYAPFREIRFY